MSVARHHAEWMSLVETSGPFLSMPVLLRVFPQGLDQRDADKASRLREAYEDWLERGAKQPAVHHAWVRHVLTDILEYPPEFLVEGQAVPPGMEAVMSNYGETLRPEFVLKHRDAGKKPLLLIEHYAPDQDLEKPVAGKIWKASPGTRMMELLHATDVPLGLVTNGEQWMIVYAPRGETTGFASLYADLWMQEPITLRAFHSLLHLRRFVGVAEPETLAALYHESSKDQQEVTNQLGCQVRQAVEMLVQAFDRIDAESQRTLLAEVSEKTLYDSALTVMMRLVFLFSADERGLLLLGDPLYDQHYAVSTLSQVLREVAGQHGEEVLERQHDAWCRLLATFRAVHAGVEHEAMRLPPYGGTLFDPDRFPFLEGRTAGTEWRTTPAKPLPINNRVVLHLLEALQVLRVKVPGGGPAEARRLSFRALDIEQIGHVYEGLLDHTAKRARETILGLAGSKDKEPEIPLTRLEELAAKGMDALVEFLVEETGRSEKVLRKSQPSVAADVSPLISKSPRRDQSRLTSAATGWLADHTLLIACGNDPLLAKRIKPFAALLREDSFGQLVVIPEGSVYVTSGTDRRSTGTHYTPRSLTEPIVQHTLEPLVYLGPAEGKPKEQWQLKSPKEILALKVCDMAMGSGAFLVQVCRYLGERLVEAWEIEETKHQSNSAPGTAGASTLAFNLQPLALHAATPSKGDPAELLLPKDPAERIMVARRAVADRCLYGVDINPMAVEMAKLSLWLITLQRDRPFTFLDHALKRGDSLLGVSSVKQIENFSLRPGERQVTFATSNLFRYVEEASAKRRALEELPSNDHTQIETKHRLHAEAEAATAKVKALADCLIAFELRGLDREAYEEQRAEEAEKVQLLMKRDADAALKSPILNQQSALASAARESLRGRRTFHWPVEFPEVFVRGGFDAFVGNPPFMGNKKITGELSIDYRELVINSIAGGVRGLADLCAYFFLRANQLLSPSGIFCLIATDTISQGGTKEVGLDQICSSGARIFRAIKSQKWPGTANVVVSIIWISHIEWRGGYALNEEVAAGITSLLTEGSGSNDNPDHLAASENIGFIGSVVLGKGFVVSPEAAAGFIRKDPKYKKVLFPLIGGEELNSNVSQSETDWVICFWDWPLNKETAPDGYSGPLAEDYPLCLDILRELVKPERDLKNRKVYRERWWRFAELQKNSYLAAASGERVLVRAIISPIHAFVFVKTGQIFNNKTILFKADHARFAFLQSSIHEKWVVEYSTSMGVSTLTYYPAACLETFPFPVSQKGFQEIGRQYHEFRNEVMQRRQEGLTKTYNRFHDRVEQSEDIARLRALHMEMDQAVAAAYGWSDLDLGHGFHATKQGERYTLSESARRTVLDRLLALNHQHYEEEAKAGLHEKKAKARRMKDEVKKQKGSATAGQTELLPGPQRDLFR